MAGDINRAAVLMTLNASSNPRSGIKDWEGKGGADYTVKEDRRGEKKKTCPTCLHGIPSMAREQMRRNVWGII